MSFSNVPRPHTRDVEEHAVIDIDCGDGTDQLNDLCFGIVEVAGKEVGVTGGSPSIQDR